MAQYTWGFDSPSGVFKSHAMSSKIYETAVANTKFMPFAKPVDGFGKKKGETVTLTRIAAISEPTSAALTEGTKISEDTYAITTTSITVSEYGRSVPFTSLAEDLSVVDIENSVQARLREQMTLSLDTVASAAFKTTQVKYTPTGVTSADTTTGSSFTSAATNNMNMYHMEQIYDLLYDTYLAPPLEGDKYIGIFRHLAVRGLMRDSDWVEWHKYVGPAAKENGEVGQIENIRVIDTNHGNNAGTLGLGKVGTSNVLGEGVVFGQDAIAIATVQEPELRAKIAGDYGRDKGVAWYGVLGMGAIWTAANAGQAKIVHVGST